MQKIPDNHVRLSRHEVVFYFSAFTLGVLYSLYQLFLECAVFDDYVDLLNDFKPGWSWIGRKQDVADSEWSSVIPLLKHSIPWILGQFLVSQYFKFKQLHPTVICSWYIVVSVSFIWHTFGVAATQYLLLLPCITCILTQFQSTLIAYLVPLMTLLIANSPAIEKIHDFIGIQPDHVYLITISFFWIQLRCISCTVGQKSVGMNNFANYFIQSVAYCLYLPTLFFGPLVLHKKFIEGVNEGTGRWTGRKIFKHTCNLLRYVAVLLITEVAMHFLYCNALLYQPRIVANLSAWAFYGLGYCMGQFFCNKYIVLYGIAGELARADDIKAPPPPKCIARIHLYSEMWKHFDRGLYEFLVTYIYVPLLRLNIPLKKFFASFATFTFIWMWHGVQWFVFVWSSLNFLAITIEAVAKTIGNSRSYLEWQRVHLSARNTRRLHCLIAVPLLAMSIVSNFYFIGGSIIGNLFLYRVFNDSLVTTISLFSLLYCMCQISTEMTIIEGKNKK